MGVGFVEVRLTITSWLAMAVPFSDDAVIVYFVVVKGVTSLFPDIETLPTPGSIVIEVAFSVCQVRRTDCPGEIFGGLATKLTTFGCSNNIDGGVGVGVETEAVGVEYWGGATNVQPDKTATIKTIGITTFFIAMMVNYTTLLEITVNCIIF